MLDPDDPDAILNEIRACRDAYPDRHIRIIACETSRGQALIRHTLTIQQPASR
jgi:ribulose bisphosphate carboxylase small subunit